MARLEPTDIGRHWGVPMTGDYAAWIADNIIPDYLTEGSTLARLEILDAADMIVFTASGTPRLKRYLHANPGQVPPDVWIDIPPVNSQAKERTGYPTQKPIALLERIILASSDPGDMVLDPFCGCATALVAADRLQCEWAGIDLSPLAIKLVDERIAGDRAACGAAQRPSRPRPSALTCATCRTIGRIATASTANRKACVSAARLTSRSALWTPTTSCPSQRAGPITPTTFNCCAQAAIAARAEGQWPNGGLQYDMATDACPGAGLEGRDARNAGKGALAQPATTARRTKARCRRRGPGRGGCARQAGRRCRAFGRWCLSP